jgi:hypothetical protein
MKTGPHLRNTGFRVKPVITVQLMKQLKGLNYLLPKCKIVLLAACVAVLCFISQASPQNLPSPTIPPPGPGGQPPLGPPPPIEQVGPGIFKLGEIRIHKDTRSIVFPARVNMDRGLLEYLIVQSRGKVHESLLRTDIEPFHLQIAFLLLGYKGTDRPILHQGSPEIPTGDPVEMLITYNKGGNGQEQKFGSHEWLVNKIGNELKEVGPLKWVYTGSKVFDGRFLAQVEGSIVALWHDPVALIDNASPGGESNRIWFSKEGTVPPAGTPVMVIIKAKK